MNLPDPRGGANYPPRPPSMQPWQLYMDSGKLHSLVMHFIIIQECMEEYEQPILIHIEELFFFL